MTMNDEDSKLVTSALMGLAGFLASHIFTRLAKKTEEQEDLDTETKLLSAQIKRLEEDLKDLKKTLAEHLREQRRRIDYDDER